MFNSRKIKRLEQQNFNLSLVLYDINNFIFEKLEKYFVCEETGSGSNTYIIDEDKLTYNEFPHKFDGFRLNGCKISVIAVMYFVLAHIPNEI